MIQENQRDVRRLTKPYCPSYLNSKIKKAVFHMIFCGRANELSDLSSRWKLAGDIRPVICLFSAR